MAKAIWEGVTLAESNQTVEVEGNQYFPSDAIKTEYFKPSATHTVCPWKGTASYYDVEVGGRDSPDQWFSDLHDRSRQQRRYDIRNVGNGERSAPDRNDRDGGDRGDGRVVGELHEPEHLRCAADLHGYAQQRTGGKRRQWYSRFHDHDNGAIFCGIDYQLRVG